MLRFSKKLLKSRGFSPQKEGGLIQMISTLSQTKNSEIDKEPHNLSEQDVRIACLRGLLTINGGRFDPEDYWTGGKKKKNVFNDELCINDLEEGDQIDVLLGYKKPNNCLIFRVNVESVNQKNKIMMLKREWLEIETKHIQNMPD